MKKDLSSEQLLKQFASIYNITEEEAQNLVGADTPEEVSQNIKKFTQAQIEKNMPPMNRKQRRALAKKLGKKRQPQMEMEMVADAAEKLNYIDLIQKLRKLNEQKEKEIEKNGETTTENN